MQFLNDTDNGAGILVPATPSRNEVNTHHTESNMTAENTSSSNNGSGSNFVAGKTQSEENEYIFNQAIEDSSKKLIIMI